jgi:hypothetical protein
VESEALMNTILYIGLGLFSLGIILFFVSMAMERYYDRKLWELEERNKYNDKL